MSGTFSEAAIPRNHLKSRVVLALVVAMGLLGASVLCPAAGQNAPGERPGYTFTKLDVPFAGVQQTEVSGINDLGWIVGGYDDSSGTHGFLLRGGVFTSIDVPGASGTFVNGINNRGDLVGGYTGGYVYDSGIGSHAFVLSKGQFTTIDIPAQDITPGQSSGDTIDASGINARGQVIGTYLDDVLHHGFMFERGLFTSFDVQCPGAQEGQTWASGINARGQIVGFYGNNIGSGLAGYMLDRGVCTRVDVPVTGLHQTFANAINDRGQIVGLYQVGSSERFPAEGGSHGFIFEKGVYTRFDVSFPDVHVTIPFPDGINNLGWIVGTYNTAEEGNSSKVFSFVARPVH